MENLVAFFKGIAYGIIAIGVVPFLAVQQLCEFF
jgi:hypothetical protein